MDKPVTVGPDLAKNVFQIHGLDAEGAIVFRRRLQVLAFFSRLEPCLVVMEACAGAHYWVRELTSIGPKCG